jgi:dTDP-4-amino-4,6-dideoxygalactose transaminase
MREAALDNIWRIPLADIDLGPEEESAVLEVMRRRWLTMGGVTAEFEADFSRLVEVAHAIAVTNCTAALHLAGLALGWGPRDEIIVPSLTFVATANAVVYTGATPVFADITSETDLNLSPEDIARRITPLTRAIIVVHYAGYPADMPAILELAERYGLDIVEDVAHAPGATLDGRPLGSWGRIGCFSFFSNKNMTTGEGGILTTDDDRLAERLRLLRSHGMTAMTWDRHKGHAWSYDVVLPGYNYRIDEIRAAIGRAQLSKLAAFNERRQSLDALYRQGLAANVPELGIPYHPSHPGVSAYHLRPVLLPDSANRRHFMEIMKAHGIQTSIHYPPIHQFSHYQSLVAPPSLPVTESVARREVTLPLYPGMTEEDVSVVVSAAAEALREAMVSNRRSSDELSGAKVMRI